MKEKRGNKKIYMRRFICLKNEGKKNKKKKINKFIRKFIIPILKHISNESDKVMPHKLILICVSMIKLKLIQKDEGYSFLNKRFCARIDIVPVS